MKRITVKVGLSAVWAGGGLLTYECGRRHLASGHSVNRVVDENHGYVLSPVQRVYGLPCAYACQVTVALIRKHQMIRPHSPDR